MRSETLKVFILSSINIVSGQMTISIKLENRHLFFLGAIFLVVAAVQLSLGATGTTPVNPGHPLSQTWIDTDLNMSTRNIIVDGGVVNISYPGAGRTPLTVSGADATGGYPIGTNKWFLAQGDGGTLDGGRVWAQYSTSNAPLLVLEDYDDTPRIQFQQVGSGTEAAPQYSGWIGMAKSSSNDSAIMGGNVGIGTTNPGTARLNVSGNIYSSSDVCIPGKCLSTVGGGGGAGWAVSGNVVYNNTAGAMVGIGTASPNSKLYVQGAAAISGTGTISGSKTITGAGTLFTTQLHVGDILIAAGQRHVIVAISSNTALTVEGTGFSPALPAGTAFTYQQPVARFANSSGGDMTWIDADGRLMIGEFGRATILDSGAVDAISISGVNRDISIASYGNGDGSKADIEFQRGWGTPQAPAIVTATTGLGQINFGAYDGSNMINRLVSIVATMDGTPGIGDLPTKLSFHTTPAGTASAVERMVIKNDGRIGIGTATPGAKLEVTNTLRLTPTTAPSPTCSAATEGTMFYNNTANRICYCDGTSYKRVDANGAC